MGLNSWIRTRNWWIRTRNSWIWTRNWWIRTRNSWIWTLNSWIWTRNSWIWARNSELVFYFSTVNVCKYSQGEIDNSNDSNIKTKEKTGILEFLDSGRNSWTLDSGLWTMDDGPWTMDPRHWTLDAGPWTLDSGRWTLHYVRWALDTVVDCFKTDSEPTFWFCLMWLEWLKWFFYHYYYYYYYYNLIILIKQCKIPYKNLDSSIVFEKPGVLSENLQTLTSSSYPTV